MENNQVNYELEDIFCEECEETHVFLLENKNGKFTLGLQDILMCL